MRPLLPHEAATGASDCVHISPEAQTAHVSGGSGRDRVFDVTKLLGPDTSQRTVYDISTRGSVKGLFAGVNSAVIAYGQVSCLHTVTSQIALRLIFSYIRG